MTFPEHDPELKDRVARLMGFLRKLAIKRSAPVTQISDHRDLLWLSDVGKHLPVEQDAGLGEHVFVVPRVQVAAEPKPPEVLRYWLDRSGDEPKLREQGPHPVTGDTVKLIDAGEVTDAFQEWLAEWRRWAEAEARRRALQQLHNRLADMERQASQQPESLEVVLAAGLLRVAGEHGATVRIHLVSQPVRIEHHRESGAIHCVVSDESPVRLEDDELIGDLGFFDRSAAPSLRKKLAATAQSPIDPQIPGFLKAWAERALDTECDISDSWTPRTTGAFRLDFAPALLLRTRGSYALRKYYEQIGSTLEESHEPVPLGLAQLVTPIETRDKLSWLERTNATAAAALAEDPLFPLPANDQQREVIRRLGEDSGVVVEGPPGTGKTHTIANLMSALLARGQRILVTSEKAQALAVLRDKLPEPLQDLCVSMTSTDRKTNAAARKSVSTLSDRHANFNAEASERWINELSARRGAAQRRRAELLERIRALRESETYQHPEISPGYAGTLSEIVRKIGATGDVGWIEGTATGEPPLSTDEFGELIRLLRDEDDERQGRRDQAIPDQAHLPDEQLVVGLTQAVAEGTEVVGGDHGELIGALGNLTDDQFRRLSHDCAQVQELIVGLRALPARQDWLDDTVSALLGQQREHLWAGAGQVLSLVDEALQCDRNAGHTPITAEGVPPSAHAAFRSFAEYLQSGGKVRKHLKKPQQKAVDAYLPTVRVGSAEVTNTGTAMQVANHLRTLEIAEMVSATFAALGYVLDTTAPRSVVVDQLVQLRKLYGVVEQVRAAQHTLRQHLTAIPPTVRPRLASLGELFEFTERTMDAARAHSAKTARGRLDHLADQVSALSPAPNRSPEHDALTAALRSHDAAAYQDAVRALDRARRQRAAQQRCDTLLDRLRRACPALADTLTRSARNPEWTDRIHAWPQAWARAVARSWVEEQTAAGAEQELEAELEATTADLEKITADLAAEQAWNACLRRMTAEQVGALNSYASNAGNAGKSGKYHERFRAAAREAMSVAQGAVPAWVMPIKHVLDTVPPRQNAFDVIIVDEASQAELTSTFLLWLAPRIIVVGDDKQCTPSEVASGALQPIFDTLDSELYDVPNYLRTEFSPRSSMFSLLRSRFGQLVRLREHFRCMPEIIQWSSNEFYQDQPLVPVRQFGADRLPPLQTQYVRGGFVEGKNQTLCNPVEADAIADSIVACLDDPAYDDKTFGVVVLQGQRQVDVITNALFDRGVDPEVWAERRLRIGTASDFQGDERHVVWLSMVVSPEQNFAPLVRASFQRSFNVAASRAQDQLILFHSVTKDRLRPGDLRLSLLEHMTAERKALDDVLTNVQRDVRHPQFDSLFEQRVFCDLVERGYHVTPQVESNGRRIDLVVTGEGAKLAVECDGDHWHTPEQLTQDLYREQELKRCGWKFWRVRESSYYLDKERALATLWTTLDGLGIRPILNTAPTASPKQRTEPRPEPPVDESVPEPAEALPALAEAPSDGKQLWPEVFPWLSEYQAGDNPELDGASTTPEWWLSSSPGDSAQLSPSAATYAIAATLLMDWPDDTPLARAFPAIPPDTRMDHLPFSSRALRLLRYLEIETAVDLSRLFLPEVLEARGIGRRTALDLFTTLADASLEPPSPADTGTVVEQPSEEEPETTDPLEEIGRWFGRFDARSLSILRRRTFADEPETLQALAAEHGVSPQRISQLESSARKQLDAKLAASGPVTELRDSVRARIQPVAALSRLLEDFPVLRERVESLGKPFWYVLDKLDDEFEVVDGWALAPNVKATRSRTELLLEDSTDRHGVVALDELGALLAEFGMGLDELRNWLVWCGYEIIDGHVLTRTATLGDRAAALLSITGEPMTAKSIAERLEVANLGGLANRLSDDRRFKRVDRGTWALSEWEFEEYTTIRDQIGQIIDRNAGSVPLNALVGELTTRFREISETSIKTFAAAAPFQTRGGIVSRSTSGPARRKGPAQTRKVFRHDSGWAYRIVITSDHLRGSGFTVPVGLAMALSLAPEQTVEFSSQLGLQSVRWSGPQPQCASIRRFLEKEDIGVGATVFLLFSDDRRFRLVEAGSAEVEPLGEALRLIGLGSDRDRPADVERALATAVCFPPDSTRDQLVTAYRERGDDDVAALLEQAWSEPTL